MKKIMRHEQKFLKIFNNEFKNLKKNFSILEFGVSKKALSTNIFLKKCKKKNGILYSIDVKDYGYQFKSKNWKFLCTRDDNYKYIEKNIPKKFDIIYLDTIHAAYHVKKILYYYFNKLKKDGVFVIDDTSYLPYLRNREKNNFPLEINNLETFEILLEILNVNHENIHLDFSFIGTGVAKITKLNNSKLKEPKNINSRKFTLQNLLRKIFIYFREKFKNSNLYWKLL